MSGARRNSIGTLTGWQLLAKQVDKDDDERGSSGSDSSSDDAEAETDNTQRQRLHLRSLSNTSMLSEDSALAAGGTSACVTPRPHQWLYKEYKILDEIGSGGFGRVCRARRLADGYMVVVKEIKTTSLSAKQKSATMDEVLVLSKLSHPNIVKYHDCYMDAVFINIVMEYCNAGDLAGLIKGREGRLMPEEEVMSLFVQICLAMHYVHMAGVLHRDLKTSNVLITRADNFGGMPLLKLGDFGVAKMNSAESSMASTIVGTPQYLSPEMCDNKPYGRKSDVWALGCILYELLTLNKAFDIGTGGISGIILKIMKGMYEPIPAGYSDEIKTLVASMLQVKPRRRPNVSEVLSMPYVRRHLGLYLDWARNVPHAHPQVLLSSLGELWPKRDAANNQQQQQQHSPPPMLDTIGSGGSCSSMDTPHHQGGPVSPQQQQQQQQHSTQLLEQQGSSPHGMAYATSSRAATPASQRISATGSNNSFVGGGPPSGSAPSSTDINLLRQGSNMSASGRSGSATPRSAAACAAAAALTGGSSMLAPAGSSSEHENQQHLHAAAGAGAGAGGAAAAAADAAAIAAAAASGAMTQTSLSPVSATSPVNSGGPIPALSGPSAGGPPPGSLSGWLGGDTSLQRRQQIQQQVLAAQQQQQHGDQQQQSQAQLQQPLASVPQKQQLLHDEDRRAYHHHQQQQQQDRQQSADQLLGSNLGMSAQQQQQQQQQRRISCPNPGESSMQQQGGSGGGPSSSSSAAAAAGLNSGGGPSPGLPRPLEPHLSTTSSQHSTDATTGSMQQLGSGWAYPSASAEPRQPTHRTSVAQEQLDGLKAIWSLKAKLQIKPDTGGGGGGGAARSRGMQGQGQQGGGSSSSQQQQAAGFWAAAEGADAGMSI